MNASGDCERQAWPYITPQCQAEREAGQRKVRVITTDRLAPPVLSAIEAQNPPRVRVADKPVPPSAPVAAQEAQGDAAAVAVAAPVAASPAETARAEVSVDPPNQPSTNAPEPVAAAVAAEATPIPVVAQAPQQQRAAARAERRKAAQEAREQRKREAKARKTIDDDNDDNVRRVSQRSEPRRGRIVERWTEREYSVRSEDGSGRRTVVVRGRRGPDVLCAGGAHVLCAGNGKPVQPAVRDLRELACRLRGHHAAAVHRQRQPAVLERQRLLAEQFAPPALHRRHVGVVVGGDAVEVVDRGDHLGGDAVAARRHAQQHLEQFDGGGAVRRRARAFEPRQGLGIAREPALDRVDDRLRPISSARSLWAASAARPSRSIVVGACTAISPITSSLSTRERGTSRVCASRSRQAATSISTASSFGLRTRVLSRCQARSGSAR